jgi:hypothetical protein
MACRKCGSGWTTIHGRDMASCPECCKIQRCVARRQGRLQPVAKKQCGRCGNVIDIEGGSLIAHTKYCRTCSPVALAESRSAYRLARVKESTKRHRLLAVVRASIEDAARGVRSQLSACRQAMSMACVPPRFCANCSKPFRPDKRRSDSCFCSRECACLWMKVSQCVECGQEVEVKGVGRNATKRRSAAKCRRCAVKAYRKTASAKAARRLVDNHRKRCRRHGVHFDSKVKSHLVFERDKFVCHICKRMTLPVFTLRGASPHPLSPTVDHHPYPLSAGIKGHEWDNVRCACWLCNTRKGARWPGQLLLSLNQGD